MVEGMSVVVNVMLSLMSGMSPPPALCNLSARTVVKLCTLVGVFALWVSLVSWIVMISVCVSWICSLRSSRLFLIPFMLTCSMMTFISLLLLGMCPCGVSVVMWSSLVCLWGCRGTLCGCCGCCDCDACTVVCIACVYAETVLGARVTAMLVWGMDVVLVSAGHVAGTRSSGIVSSAADVLWMSLFLIWTHKSIFQHAYTYWKLIKGLYYDIMYMNNIDNTNNIRDTSILLLENDLTHKWFYSIY